MAVPPRSRFTTSMMPTVAAMVCGSAPPVCPQQHLGTRGDTANTWGDQSPAIIGGRDVTASIQGYTPVRSQDLIDLVSRPSTEATEVRRELGVTEGAALTMPHSRGRVDTPVAWPPKAMAEPADWHGEAPRGLNAAGLEVARPKERVRAVVEARRCAVVDRLPHGAGGKDLAAERRIWRTRERRRDRSDRRRPSWVEARCDA